MNKKTIYFLGAIAVLMSVSGGLFATQSNDFGAADIADQSNKIKDFLFSTPMKVACVFGGAYGLFQAIMTSAIRPLLLYGGIALGANIMPKFVDSVFVSGMLLP
ncbi:MAG: hypothetical protein ACE5GN_05025 [Waddliaceae bacterium]